MMIWVTMAGLLVAWCAAVLYIRFRPSSPDAPLNTPIELDMGTPVEVQPVVHGRVYNIITYAAPVAVGIVVVIMFVVLMVPVFHS